MRGSSRGDNRHIEYKEFETTCMYCNVVLGHYTENNYEEHRFNNWNECKECGYDAGCNHQWTSRKTANYWYEVYDGYYHSEVYIEEEVCNNCGDVLGSQQKSKIVSHYFQNGKCWDCGYIQQTTSQPQYIPPVVNEPEYVEPEPEEEYVEEPVYVEQPQQNTNVLPYQQALEEGRVYASTDDGLHLYKRNYAPNDYRGYEDKYYHTVKTVYDNFTLPPGEVFAQKGDYLYRHSDNGGGVVAASPSIIKACDYRINELKNTLKGASDASTRISQYKQVKRGQMPLSSISERNKRYLAQTGSSNSYVTRVQEALNGLGYTSQIISGKLDSTTLNNIAYFQSVNGIYMTGWIDQETYDRITSSYTSYTNAQQKAARAPYVYLSDVHMEGKELVVSMQGNANTTVLAVKLRYNGSVVSSEYFENTNYGVAYLAPRESGIHYIEFFAKNAEGDIYEAPSQEIDLNLVKSIIVSVAEDTLEDLKAEVETRVGVSISMQDNLVVSPVLGIFDIIDRIFLDKYSYSEKQQKREEIANQFRNGIAEYLDNPQYYYEGLVIGDVLSIGAEIYFGVKSIKGVKGIVKNIKKLGNGVGLVDLSLVSTSGAVVGVSSLVIDTSQVGKLVGGATHVGIISNMAYNTWGNIQNAVTGNSSSGNDASMQKAIDIANQVKANNGNAPSGYKGGGRYQNIPLENGAQKLPEGVNYREYDINPYVKGQNRGAERIVIGDDGSVWYTNDHYYTFTRIQ